MSQGIVITGSGLYTPPHRISNDELVNSFNTYVDNYNDEHKEEIEKGQLSLLEHSSASFIEKASGIKSRFVIDKAGILDPKRMRPFVPTRSDDVPSLQCEMALHSIKQALEKAEKSPAQIDGIIVSCSNVQRSYPGMAMEIQHHLGSQGYGFDMNVACSSATFAISTAHNALLSNQNKCIAVVNPEISSGHINYRDRDSHFIFGDVSTALILEQSTTAKKKGFEIVGIKLGTQFSNNIRNNSGFLNHAELEANEAMVPTQYFKQNGRKVFKEVVPLVEAHILAHLESLSLTPQAIKRYWLHQANINMNELIMKKILGKDANQEQAPLILQEFANTASTGSIIAFHQHHHDFSPGELGLICSFGAGYSIGSILVRKTL